MAAAAMEAPALSLVDVDQPGCAGARSTGHERPGLIGTRSAESEASERPGPQRSFLLRKDPGTAQQILGGRGDLPGEVEAQHPAEPRSLIACMSSLPRAPLTP